MINEYNAIKEFYSNLTAKRSGLPLIKHIDDGLKILEALRAPPEVHKAFCLHPIVQNDKDFVEEFFSGLLNKHSVDTSALMLALEYRIVANSFLSDKWDQDFRDIKFGPLERDVRLMLKADKVQNYCDFLTYHKKSHERSYELEVYFQKWFIALDLTSPEVANLIRVIL